MLFPAACGHQNNTNNTIIRVIPEKTEEQTETVEKFGEIIETQDGPGAANLPDWVNWYIGGGIAEIESTGAGQDRYFFVGKTHGRNFHALQQWADGFSVSQDFPRLATARIENRMIAAAALYPDDEYGEYFEALIKQSSDAQYPGAVKEAVYWLKTRTIQQPENDDADPDEIIEPLILERYEFLVLISIDKMMLQNRIRELLANIETDTAPTRAQSAAINRVQQSFFGGF